MFKIITSLLVCAIVAILFLSNVMSVKEIAPITPPPKPKTLNSEILWSLIQDWRVKNNLQSYIKDQKLCEFANVRLKEIQNDHSHKGFLNKSDSFMAKYGFNSMAENLAEDFGPDELVLLNAWLNSPNHRKDLEYPYDYSCLVTSDRDAVQIFASY